MTNLLQQLGGHLQPGHSRHLGGPWYVQASPDTGRLYFAKDHGTGVHEVDRAQVPDSVIARHT